MAWNKLKDSAKGLTSKGLDVSKDLAEKCIEAAKEKREQKKAEEQELKDRIKQMDKEGIVYCPKCYSTDLTANKRGWKMTTGLIGRNKIEITCLKCGNKFKPGKK